MARRTNLLNIEKNIQNLWKEHNICEREFVDKNESRFTGNFPYPYMNGLLHIGHAFTLSKLEFLVRYKNMICDNVLLPFSFHCTGTPIVVCADKLKNELKNKTLKNKLEGKYEHQVANNALENREDEGIVNGEQEVEKGTAMTNTKHTTTNNTKDNTTNSTKDNTTNSTKDNTTNSTKDNTMNGSKNIDATIFRSNKSKAQSKGSKQNTQYEIMKQMNIGDDEIHLFQNPEYWCYYFSSKAKEHLNSFGLYCDWRRSFITTNMNQYYDKFVNWQFNTLYKKNLIYYGSRITIFSRVNNQACADHERSEGEGVKCQEYTLIKIYVHDYKEFYTIFTNTCRTASSSTTTATAASTATMKGVSFSPSEEDRHLKNEIFNEDFFKKKKIILLGSTLKPETAYGQNYTFVNPNDYYYVTLGFDKQVLHYGDKNYVNNILTKEDILEKCENIYICSENSLYNMAYQGIIPLLMRMDKSNWGGSADGKTATSSDCSSVGVNSSGASANNKLDNINDLRDVLVLCKIKGESLIGLRTYTNLSKIKNLYILPMTTIKMNVSTAIVPCVSSDSTDDYACLEEIRKKKNFYCEKYNLKEEYLNNESHSCIELPEIGTNSGKYYYDNEKIVSSKDAKLQKIKEVLYKKQYFEGTMTVEPYVGMKTFNCRKLAKQYIIKNNEGFLYNEPEVLVIDRNNVKCIAALCNQWYINYGNLEFKKDVLIQLKKTNFQTYNDVLYKQLQHVIFWLDDWSCSRAYGLGTYMPDFNSLACKGGEGGNPVEEKNISSSSTDDKYMQSKEVAQEGQKEQIEEKEMQIRTEKELIESLSDSTIYMAYYTISHFLQGSVDGKDRGLLNIEVNDLNDEFFDYVFDISDDTSKISKNITTDKLKKIRREFQYWYPFDVRISGKDLIFNHLTMALFNHVAIWGKKIYKKNKECHMEEKSILDKQNEILNEIDQLDLNNYETIKYFPKSFFCNGHVLVNKEKMSKSKGNFITIEESIGLYTSDGTRIALADAGDSIEDANFNTDTANSAIMKLYNLINFCIETKNNVYIFRCGEKTFNDRIFENEINYLTNKCKESYEKLLFRDVLKYGFYDMLLKRDTYRIMCDKIHMHKDTVNFFIERICIIINPIIPHITEHIWTYILKKEKFLINQKWPPTEHTNFSIVMHKQYNNLLNVVEIFRKSYDKVINKNNKQKTKSDTSEVNQGKKSTMSVSKSSVPNNSMIKSNETNEVNNHKQQPEGQCKEMINKNGIQKGGVDHVNNVNVNPCVSGNTNVSNNDICKNYEEENYKDDEEEGMKFKAIVYVAREYNDTQKKIIDILNSIINNSEDKKLPSNYINLLVQNPYVNNLPKNEKKEILSFATFLVKDNVTLNNNQYELTLPYDEIQLIKNNVDFMKRSLNLGDIQVLENTKKCEIDNTDIYKLSNPGNPSIFMYNVES
ncbi:leucine--tRNA ligase [Plasmodium brasilianum]|uniref:Leucine--tRNA ligase n=1 Tax=Plasmodium brasilianum TaxID=5824 RepID=A0ACB9Y7M0_PLABR|nr:leucine--tRNA ligase [Plasmodium brasilianum]